MDSGFCSSIYVGQPLTVHLAWDDYIIHHIYNTYLYIPSIYTIRPSTKRLNMLFLPLQTLGVASNLVSYHHHVWQRRTYKSFCFTQLYGLAQAVGPV